MHIMTDSMYVKLGLELWRHKWRAHAWYRRVAMKQEIDHADLWHKVDEQLRNRQAAEVKITWLKGHALPKHIGQGVTADQLDMVQMPSRDKRQDNERGKARPQSKQREDP